MPSFNIVGFAGSTSNPSRTRSLVQAVAASVARRSKVSTEIFDLGALLPTLAITLNGQQATGELRRLLEAIAGADAIIVGSPVYKGTYSGLFKHVFDLIEPKALKGKPVVLTATGGSERHALAIEHGLRPLFAFFAADIVATAVYATESEFADYRAGSPSLLARIERAADELGWRLTMPRTTSIPAAIAAFA